MARSILSFMTAGLLLALAVWPAQAPAAGPGPARSLEPAAPPAVRLPQPERTAAAAAAPDHRRRAA
ncbi:MAG: hypothetical protein R6X35_01105, partial [Candidatus Krumholzibacteriia bacterium]